MKQLLTLLPRSVIARLRLQRLADVAEDAQSACPAGERFDATLIHLTDAELRAGLERANDCARWWRAWWRLTENDISGNAARNMALQAARVPRISNRGSRRPPYCHNLRWRWSGNRR